MKTVILCAGRSKRLKPISDKTLLNFNGKPSLLHKLESLSLEGLNDFILVVGEHNKLEISQLLSKTNYSYQITEQENLEQGMAGAIKAVAQIVTPQTPILVVSNNDTTDQSLLKKIVHNIEQNPKESLIVGKKVAQYFPGGYIEHDDLMYLTNIIEKPEPGTEPSDMINLVYHYFANPDQLYAEVQKVASDKDDLYEQALLNLVKVGQKFKVLPYMGEWIPIKNPLHIIATARFYAQKEQSKGIHPKAEIHPSAIIRGSVIIEEGAKIDANAVIQGPAYIGKNTIIGVGSFIRDSYIGHSSVIGFASEVARSYLGSHTWLHKNYIGDSVIGNNVSFGAGCLTGNLRLDEEEIAYGSNKFGLVTGDNIRVGISTIFMPSINIGSNSMISASLNVTENIPENSFVKGDNSSQKLVIKENTKLISIRD